LLIGVGHLVVRSIATDGERVVLGVDIENIGLAIAHVVVVVVREGIVLLTDELLGRGLVVRWSVVDLPHGLLPGEGNERVRSTHLERKISGGDEPALARGPGTSLSQGRQRAACNQ